MATFGLVTFTDSKLAKIIRSIYTFWDAAHRQRTLANLRVGGDTLDSAANTAIVVTNGSTYIHDASLSGSSRISLAAAASATITVSNMADGQAVRVLIDRAGQLGVMVIGGIGVWVSNPTGANTQILFFQVGASLYFVQSEIA